MAPVQILSVDAVGGHLIAYMLQHNRHSAVLNAGVDGVLKQGLDLIWLCRSGDIPIGGNAPEDRVPDASTYGIGLKTRLFPSMNNLPHRRRQINCRSEEHNS